MEKPHFVIKNKFQRRDELYSDILTSDILEDVCNRVTGRSDYTCEFDNTGYNKGRLATIEFGGTTTYVSFSEIEVGGRNSSFQSFSSALVQYHQEENNNKRICFYFLSSSGNIKTAYFLFMYRLMKTAGVEFLNESEHLTTVVSPFTTVEDIIANRNINRGRNRSNKSTYLTRSFDNTIQIYGKTYGANKYETTLLCIALRAITTTQIEVYQIAEQNLIELPAPVRKVIIALGKVKLITTDLTIERRDFEENDSLRSVTYIYNLLLKLGDKKCVFCNCEIPQIIEGAHIWPVAEIKKVRRLSPDQKLKFAIDGENGIWLCQNHHKIMDANLLKITGGGNLEYKSNIETKSVDYIKEITTITQLENQVITPEFIKYLERRNGRIQRIQYEALSSV